MMEKEFQMPMMGELTFFLGIQVKQTKKGMFVHQAKYTKDLMKKFNIAELKPVSTPMSTTMALDPDENGKVVDQREYRSMIGSLLYLMVTRPDIQFTVCLCARFSSFSMLLTSDNRSVDFHISQIHTQIWDLIFRIFIT
jgi:hypothetical protein